MPVISLLLSSEISFSFVKLLLNGSRLWSGIDLLFSNALALFKLTLWMFYSVSMGVFKSISTEMFKF